jgi:alpha-ribazole phosphatase/probable phosphoglycerate mutase
MTIRWGAALGVRGTLKVLMRLTLIRHGMTEWNALGRFQGQSDIPLSEVGETQAAALAGYAASFPPVDLLLSSPLQRARQTAALVFPSHPLRLDARISELHFGAFEGMTRDQIERDPRWLTWMEDPYHKAPPGGEAYVQLRERVAAWLSEMRLRADGDHVVAITHSGAIQMLLAEVLGVEHPRWRKRVYVRHTGVCHILFRGREAIIERVNDTRHLVPDGTDPFSE